MLPLKKYMLFLLLLPVLIFVGCSADSQVNAGTVDKSALISLLHDFERIPQTLDQSELVNAYTLVRDDGSATQKQVNQAVTDLKELKALIFSSPMSFIDGGLEPHVRIALNFPKDKLITIGDCFSLTELDCMYNESLGTKMRVAYDFRYFPNLKKLDLTGNAMDDLSGFAYLEDLEVLSLANNPAKSSNLTEEDSVQEVRSFDILGKLPLKELDLSGTSVLPSLSVLPVMSHLRNLNISQNTMDTLAGIDEKFPQLNGLLASDCSLRDISSLGRCVNIKNLDLSRSQISDLTPLTTLKSLEQLVLDGVTVSDVSVLSNFSDLRVLSLSGCGIRDVSWIADLTDLETLILSSNQISDVTVSDGNMAVRKLDLSQNAITSFSLSKAWANIQELNLSKNALTSFSVTVDREFCLLKILDLSDNALISFNGDSAQKLESLNLSGNALGALRLSSESLRSLILAKNPLTELRLELPNLVTLNLACATAYTEISFNLPALKILDLSEPFSSPTDFLTGLDKLETLSLNLSLNPVNKIGPFASLQTLTLLSATDGHLATMEGLPLLERLTVDGSSVVSPTLTGLPALKRVTFSNCPTLTELMGFAGVPTLEALSVTGGTVSTPRVASLENLRTLALNSCGVADLSGIQNLPALESLSLAGNGLTSVSVRGFGHLRNLDLSNNALASATGIDFDITEGVLNLSGNAPTLYESLPSVPDGVTLLTESGKE